MTASPSALPRLHGAVPLVHIAPDDVHTIEWAVGVALDVMHPVGDGVFIWTLDVPAGDWLVWPDAASALWIGARPDALPAVGRRAGAEHSASTLRGMLDRLAAIGVWLREGALRSDGRWSPPQRGDRVLAGLDGAHAVDALSGIWTDAQGRSARMESAQDGVLWTDRPTLSVQWLLASHHLPAPT